MATSAICRKETEITAEMIEVVARILEDRFESLPTHAAARELAEDVLRMALDARHKNQSQNPEAVPAIRKTDAQTP